MHLVKVHVFVAAEVLILFGWHARSIFAANGWLDDWAIQRLHPAVLGWMSALHAFSRGPPWTGIETGPSAADGTLEQLYTVQCVRISWNATLNFVRLLAACGYLVCGSPA